MNNEKFETTALDEEEMANILDEAPETTEEIVNPEKPDYVTEIVDIIQSDKESDELAGLLDDYHDNDLADALELMTPEERHKLYDTLPAEDLADIFERLDQLEVETYIVELNENEVSRIIGLMEADKAVDFEKRQIILFL